MQLDTILKEDNLENHSVDEQFDHIFNSTDISNNLQLCFQLFERKPTYHILFEMNMEYKTFTSSEKTVLWNNYINILNSDNTEGKKQICY